MMTSPFAFHVQHVGGVGAEEQMIGLATASVVAVMQDIQTIGDGAECQHPSDAMGLLNVTSKIEVAVTDPVDACDPVPASVGLLDLRPEARFNRPRLSEIMRSSHWFLHHRTPEVRGGIGGANAGAVSVCNTGG
jgi:hypothetical protein